MSQLTFDSKPASKERRDTARVNWILYILIGLVLAFVIGWEMAPRFIGYYVEVALLNKPLFPPGSHIQQPK